MHPALLKRRPRIRSAPGLFLASGLVSLALIVGQTGTATASTQTASPHAASPPPAVAATANCSARPVVTGLGTCAGTFTPARSAAPKTAGTLRASAALGSPPSGLTPDDLAQAYGLQGATGPETSGGYRLESEQGVTMTVAIVEAGLPISGDTLAAGNAQIESDLNSYRTAESLPACTTSDGCLSVVDGTSAPSAYYGWGQSYEMDLDAVSAICEQCHILLVEAPTDETSDYFAAANIAANTAGVDVVDMDYVTPEFQTDALGNSEQYYDTNDISHPGIAMVAPSGNSGYGPLNYPAASPDVISVGGTVLNETTSSSTWSDTAPWDGTTSGCSEFEAAPTWQTSAATLCPGDGNGPERVDNDISAAAAISTNGASTTTAAFPFVYYDTALNPPAPAWSAGGGGTELATDIIAGAYALAGAPESGVNPASYLYSNAAASAFDIDDITSGSTTNCPADDALCTASAGWDPPTGWGTPDTTLTLTPTGSVTGDIIEPAIGYCPNNMNRGETNGNPIAEYECGATNETWTVEDDGTIRMFSGSYCMTTASTASGADVELWTCDGATSQQWRFTSAYTLYNPASNKCLAQNSDLDNGTQMYIEPCPNVATVQVWQPYELPVVTGGIHSQENESQCLDNSAGKLTAGNEIDIYTCHGGADEQEWTTGADGNLEIGGSYCVMVFFSGSILEPCEPAFYDVEIFVVRSDGSLFNPASGECLYESGTANSDAVDAGDCEATSSYEWTMPWT
jgi:subtilase family serine protease